MHTHTIHVNEALTALDTELAEFSAAITVNLIPDSGDGWNEPREPGYAEFASVVLVSGPEMHLGALDDWAEAWVTANQAEIYENAAEWAGS